MNLSNNTSESPVSVLSPVLFSHTCVYLFSPLNSEHKFLPSPTISVPIPGTRPPWQCPLEEQSQELSWAPSSTYARLLQRTHPTKSCRSALAPRVPDTLRKPRNVSEWSVLMPEVPILLHTVSVNPKTCTPPNLSSTFCWFRLPKGGRREQGFRPEPQRRLSCTLISLCIHDN